MKFISVLAALAVFLVFALWVSMYVGLAEGQDGFHYVALGEYLVSKANVETNYFYAKNPTGLYPPIYPLVLMAFLKPALPHTMTYWILFQELLMFLSAVLIGTIAYELIGKRFGWLAFAVFLFYPFTVVYATTFWAETFTVFLIAVYLRLLVTVLKKKSSLSPGILVLVSSLLFLTKLVFQYLILFSIVIWIVKTIQKIKSRKYVPVVFSSLLVMVSILLASYQFLFIHRIYGIWNSTTFTGRNLYYGVVFLGHFLPDKNDQAYKNFVHYVPESQLFEGSWLWEYHFQEDFTQGKITEVDIDNLENAFAKAAIKNNLRGYLRFAVENFFVLPTSSPKWWPMFLDLGYPDPMYPQGTPKVWCRVPWNRTLCTPDRKDPKSIELWIQYISGLEKWYPWGAWAAVILAYIGIAGAFIKRNIPLLCIAGIYGFVLFVHALVAHDNGRYFLLNYPMFAILITQGIATTLLVLGKLKIRFVGK